MEQSGPDRADPRRWLLDTYVVLVTAVLIWPLLRGQGYPVARDMVFTPRVPLRAESLGLGSGSPRAAPLDAIMAALTTVLDGGVLATVLVPVPLLLAGWGAHRLLPDASILTRLVVAGVSVWNPFVAERLGLGQWALLFGYAAVIHIVRLTVTAPLAAGALGRTAPWLAVGAITPTGALLGAATAVGLLIRRRRRWGVLLLAALVQLPWIVPGLLSTAGATSDPAGIAAFAARGERLGGPLWSLLGMGGIWDGLSVPGSRGGLLGHVTSIAVVVVLALGWRSGRIPGRVWILGGGGLMLALLSSLPGGRHLLEALVTSVPGAGLLRDAQKWLVPFVVLVLLCCGVAVEVFLAWCRRRLPVLAATASGLAVLAPFLLLPDGAVVVHEIVRPVSYPADYRAVAARVDGSDSTLVSLPWRLYRRFDWSGPYPAYDPASRWFDTRVVTTDELILGDRTVRGEDPVAARLAPAARAGDIDELGRLGVRFVLIHRDDGAPAPDLGGRRPVYAGESLILIDLGGEVEPSIEASATSWARVALVLGIDLAVLIGLATTGVVRALFRDRRSATLR